MIYNLLTVKFLYEHKSPFFGATKCVLNLDSDQRLLIMFINDLDNDTSYHVPYLSGMWGFMKQINTLLY